MAQEELALDICVIGDSGVGKSALLQKLFNPDLTFETIAATGSSTIGIDYKNFRKEIILEQGKPAVSLNVRLWDTAGQERFRTVTRQYTRNKDAIVFMFEMSSPTMGSRRHASLEHLKSWYVDMMPMEPNSPERNDVAVALCCTKLDLASSTDPVHMDETLDYCRNSVMPSIASHSHDVHVLGKTSCISGEGIEQFFDAVFRAAIPIKRKKLQHIGYMPSTRRITEEDLTMVSQATTTLLMKQRELAEKEKAANSSSCC